MLSSESYGRLRKLLELHEKRMAMPYLDQAGNLTIGVGRNLTANGLRSEEIDYLLTNDIEDALHWLHQYNWFSLLDEPRQVALIDMMVNLGPTKFAGFQRMIACLSTHNWAGASAAALDSFWAGQVGDRAKHDA